MQKKENTPKRLAARRYEEKHKTERKEKHKVWATSIQVETAEEIDSFLKENHFTKVELIIEGFNALKKRSPNSHGANTRIKRR